MSRFILFFVLFSAAFSCTVHSQAIYSPERDWNVGYNQNFLHRQSVKKLSLASDTFSLLPRKLNEFTNLEYIELSGERGMDLSEAIKTLSNFTKLKGLYLYRFKTLPANIISLHNLKEIRFTECGQMDIETAVERLVNIPKLEIIGFNTPLTKIPQSLARIKNLRSLLIPTCSKDINREFFSVLSSVKKLETLKIIEPQFEISSDIQLLQNIHELQIELFGNYESNIEKLGSLKLLKLTLFSAIIPENLSRLSTLTELRINDDGMYVYYYLAEFPKSIFQLINLQRLTVNGGRISEVPLDVQNLKNLEYLDLSHNQLKSFPDVFKTLKKITYINFCSNSFTELPPSLYTLQQLQILKMDDNFIDTIDNRFTFLTNLHSLSLLNNPVSRFPNGAKLTNLSYAAIGGGDVPVTITKDIEQLENLTELYLGVITSLPSELKLLKKIQDFTFSIPFSYREGFDWIIPLSSLESLTITSYDEAATKQILTSVALNQHLENLKLNLPTQHQIPVEIYKIKSLKRLEIIFPVVTQNPFTAMLSPEIINLNKLEELRIKNYHLNTLPVELKMLTNIKTLDFSDNEFTIIPDVVFDLPKLENLSLSGNKISLIPAKLYQHSVIQYVDLRGNLLSDSENTMLTDKIILR